MSTKTPRSIALAAKLISDAVKGRDSRACGLMYDLCRKLETEICAQPREWDAETIKEAPEGVYMVHKVHGDWFQVRDRAQAAHYVCKENPSYPFSGPKPGSYDRAFGPIPQPPAPTTGEAG